MRNLLLAFLLLLSACSGQTNKQQETSSTATIVAQDTAVAEKAALKMTPMDMAGDLGRVTFSQKELTIFYYDHKTKQGEIILNSKNIVLDKYNFDSKKETYEIGNNDVSIVTGHCAFKENEGSDCFYGNIKEVSIRSKEGELILHDVDVQDCPAN